MSIFGNTDLWSDAFPGFLIPEILDLVVASWKEFTKPNLDDLDDLEVRITRLFSVRLKNNKNLRQLPFIILREQPEDNLETGEEIGRIDLRFTNGYREDVYFAFECKRLNVDYPSGKKSLATEYVKDGMMRFITSQYASNLSQGGMIGYVMDGSFSTATKAVEKKINENFEQLCMKEQTGLSKSSLKPGVGEIKETLHKLQKVEFIIHHVFLCF